MDEESDSQPQYQDNHEQPNKVKTNLNHHQINSLIIPSPKAEKNLRLKQA